MRARASMSRRWAPALAALLLAVPWLLPASALAGQERGNVAPPTVHAEVSPDAPEFKDLKDFLGELGFQADAIAVIAKAANPDRLADWFNPNDLSPDTVLKRPGTDIATATFFELGADQATVDRWFDKGGPLGPGAPGVVISQNPVGAQRGTEWYAYATTLSAPIAGDGGGRVEGGLAAFTTTLPGGVPGVRYEANPSFPGDFFNHFDVAWSTRSDVGGGFSLLSFNYLPAGGGWVPADTDAVSLIRGELLITLIPEGEASGFQDARAFTFIGIGQNTAVDTFPGLDQEAVLVVDLPTITVGAPATQAPASAAPGTAIPGTAAPGATAGPTTGGTDTAGGVPWWVLVVIGVLIAIVGVVLVRPRRPQVDVRVLVPAGLSTTTTAAAEDPCPPLIAAAAAARAACDAALIAAASATDAARARNAEAEEAKRAADRARKARQAAEKELDERQKPPDTGQKLGETNFDGRHVEVDEYDLKLQADARSAANAVHSAAVAGAKTDAEREQAHAEWQAELKRLDGPDGLDEVRRRDRTGREQWIKDAATALETARSADTAARDAMARAIDTAATAQQTAEATRRRADEACADADRAEAAAADCLPGKSVTMPAGTSTGTAPGGGGPGASSSGAGTTPGTTTNTTPGATPGGTPPPTSPRPHGTDCPDGTEQWRAEPPSATFVVPVPGEKVRMTVIPGIDAFTEYYDGWAGFGADGKPLDGTTEQGIPPSAFVRADDLRWNQLFGKIGKKAKHNEITITLPLQSVDVHCERLYTCVNGHWERQARTRAVDSDSVAKPASLHLEGEVITTNEVVILGRTAVNAMKAAEQARHDLATFSSRCR